MLSLEQIQRKELVLKSYIEKLASKSMDDNELEEFIKKLEDFYLQDFRHSYSNFFPIITELGNNLEFLSNNLSELKKKIGIYYEENPQKYLYLYKRFFKLSDHLNLEIGRYNHYSEKEQRTKELEQKLIATRTQLEAAQNELKKALPKMQEAEEKLTSAQKKIESVQSELITVLSIFAAIVMTFSGSMQLLGSALTGLSNITVLESILFVLLCGFIVFNLIFAMMYFIAKITGRSIYARCETTDCTCKDNKFPKCNGFIRVCKRLPYVVLLNSVILIFALIDLVIMLCVGLV